MSAPALRLALLVVGGSRAPDQRAIGRLERPERFAQEHQRGLIDAQELLVSLALAGLLRPDELTGLVQAEAAGHRADGVLAEKVRPDDQRPRHLRRRLGQPLLGELAIGAHVLEAE